MNAPGVGPHDIVKKCMDIICTSFANEDGNAPASVQGLVDTCWSLINVFSDLSIIDNAGVSEVLEELPRTFVRRLEECDALIKRHDARKKAYRPSHYGAWMRTRKTGQYDFVGKRAKELQRVLHLETEKLLLFVMTWMRCVPIASAPAPERLLPTRVATADPSRHSRQYPRTHRVIYEHNDMGERCPCARARLKLDHAHEHARAENQQQVRAGDEPISPTHPVRSHLRA